MQIVGFIKGNILNKSIFGEKFYRIWKKITTKPLIISRL